MGSGTGGAIKTFQARMTNPPQHRYLQRGGRTRQTGSDADEAGVGGGGYGGAVSAKAASSLVLSEMPTVSDNHAVGGTGGSGPFRGDGGQAAGGAFAVQFQSTLSSAASRIVHNAAVGGSGGLGITSPGPRA